MQHLVDQLQLAGLSEREAKVYLASLSMGPSAVQELSDLAGIARSTAYPVIEALMDTGLMSTIERDGKRIYSASPPDQMVNLVKTRAEELLYKMRALENALPEFLALERKHEWRPHASVFEGKEGIREIARRFEETPGMFFEIVPHDAFRKFFEEKEFDAHRETLVRGRSHGKIIVVAEKPPVDVMCAVHERYGWHVRYMPSADMPLTGHISVKGNEVFGFTYDHMPIGIILKNASLARTLTAVFELAWRSAPRDFAFPRAEVVNQ